MSAPSPGGAAHIAPAFSDTCVRPFAGTGVCMVPLTGFNEVDVCPSAGWGRFSFEVAACP